MASEGTGDIDRHSGACGTLAASGMSGASKVINTAFVERQNGTARHRNARKA